MLDGLIAIETRLSASTVTVVDPDTPFCAVAVIVTGLLVTPTAVARPLVVIVTFVTSEEVQVTILVTSCCVPSLKVASASYCCCSPKDIGEFAGVTMMFVILAALTVNNVLPKTGPNAAFIVV